MMDSNLTDVLKRNENRTHKETAEICVHKDHVHVRTQWKDGHLQDKKRGLRRNQTC